jgi:chromosome segregation ATPase
MSRKQATEQHRLDAEAIGALSNKWVMTSGKLDEQMQANAMYEKDLDGARKALADLTNNFTQVSANYSQVSANLSKTEAELKATVEEVKKRDTKISELEGQNQALDKQALDLSTSITNLTVQITETQRKLAASEGDKIFLTKELKRLTAEKAELERQFNDLKVLKAQVARLKEELSIARRIEWIRRGLFASSEEKGAAKLMTGITSQPGQAKAPRPNYDLNVELNPDGTVRVLTPPTNPPAPTPTQK